MKKYFFATVCSLLIVFGPFAWAGEGAEQSAVDKPAWELDVDTHDDGNVVFGFYVNPAHAIQRVGGERYMCATYTPTGHGNEYKRIPIKEDIDLSSPNVDIGIDARGLDRIAMHRTEDGWRVSKPVPCDKVHTGINIKSAAGGIGPFGRRKMTWLCYEASLRRGEGVIKYNDRVLSLTELQDGSGPIAFASYNTPDGKKDGFLIISACMR